MRSGHEIAPTGLPTLRTSSRRWPKVLIVVLLLVAITPLQAAAASGDGGGRISQLVAKLTAADDSYAAFAVLSARSTGGSGCPDTEQCGRLR